MCLFLPFTLTLLKATTSCLPIVFMRIKMTPSHLAVCVKQVLIECKFSIFHFCLDNTVNSSKHGWENETSVPRRCLTNNFNLSVNLKNLGQYHLEKRTKHECKENNLSNARLRLPFSAVFFSEVVVVLHGDVECVSGGSSEHGAPFTPLLHGRGAQHSSDGFVKYRFQAPLGERGALQVLYSPWWNFKKEL